MKRTTELKLNKMFWIDKHKCLGHCIKIDGDQGIFLLQKPIGPVKINKEEVKEYSVEYERSVS